MSNKRKSQDQILEKKKPCVHSGGNNFDLKNLQETLLECLLL